MARRGRSGTLIIVGLMWVGALALIYLAGLGIWNFLQGPTPDGEPTAVPGGDEWLYLLEGEHAQHWENVSDDRDIFTLENGILHIPGQYPLRYVAYTAREFEDFDLHLEFKLGFWSNSGVFLRSRPEAPVSRGFEVQVLDDHGYAAHKRGTGGIYDVVTPMFNMARPRGEWNSYDISVRGAEVTITVNGWKVIDTDFAQMTEPIGKFDTPYAELPQTGFLMLQDHGGSVWYRNIAIRPVG